MLTIGIFLVSLFVLLSWAKYGPRGRAVIQTLVGVGLVVSCVLRLAGVDRSRPLFDSDLVNTLWIVVVLGLGIAALVLGVRRLRELSLSRL